jgi:hypothetical protein
MALENKMDVNLLTSAKIGGKKVAYIINFM